MEKIWTTIREFIMLYGLKVLAALAIIIIGRWVAKGIRRGLRKVMGKGKVDPTLISFASSLIYIALMVFIIIAALGQLGVQTTSFVAVLGAAGLAIGLALQGSLANFAAGILMVIFRPFKVGDFIEAGGCSGTVEIIGVFNTEIKTPDNKRIILPNSKVTGDAITNYSAEDRRRIDLVIGVSYEDNLDTVKRILLEIIKKETRILEDPEPTIGVLELADSSVNFAVRPWVPTADYWSVYFSLMETIKKRFDAEGISIPYPQQDIHYNKIEETIEE